MDLHLVPDSDAHRCALFGVYHLRSEVKLSKRRIDFIPLAKKGNE